MMIVITDTKPYIKRNGLNNEEGVKINDETA